MNDLVFILIFVTLVFIIPAWIMVFCMLKWHYVVFKDINKDTLSGNGESLNKEKGGRKK